VKKWIQATGSGINKGCLQICAALIMLCMALSFADVVSRMVTKTTIMWSQQVAVWSMCALVFLGAGAMLWERSHINVDMLYQLLKGLPRKSVDVINHMAAVAFALILLIASITYVIYLYSTGVTRLLGTAIIPYWLVVLICTGIGSFLIVGYSIIMVVGIIRKHTGEENQAK